MFMMMRIDLTISTTSITISMFIVMKMTNPIQSFVCFRKFRMAHELEIDKVLVILFHSVVFVFVFVIIFRFRICICICICIYICICICISICDR